MPDYIIVGQGICGSFLSYYLQKAGKHVLVIDNPQPNTASKAASGIINPVTGRRIVKTWLADELLPFAISAYADVEKELNAQLIRQCNALDFFATPQVKNAFADRAAEDPELLKMMTDTEPWQPYFRFNYGIGEINPCYLTDIQSFLILWRQQLQKNNALQEDEFEVAHCKIENEQIDYKNIKAEKIIFCDGVSTALNPFFHMLPFAFNKGEALLVNIDHLPQTNIYKQGINIVPWKEKNMFWVGSNYIWDYTDLQPSASFRQRTEEHLTYWLRLPFRVIDHFAAERPANVERRPFVGLHPKYNSVGILNGMGTKGCSLAPYFAYQFAQHLLHNSTIEPAADVKRFTRVLSR